MAAAIARPLGPLPLGTGRQEGPIFPSWAQSVQTQNKSVSNEQKEKVSVLQIKIRIDCLCKLRRPFVPSPLTCTFIYSFYRHLSSASHVLGTFLDTQPQIEWEEKSLLSECSKF